MVDVAYALLDLIAIPYIIYACTISTLNIRNNGAHPIANIWSKYHAMKTSKHQRTVHVQFRSITNSGKSCCRWYAYILGFLTLKGIFCGVRCWNDKSLSYRCSRWSSTNRTKYSYVYFIPELWKLDSADSTSILHANYKYLNRLCLLCMLSSAKLVNADKNNKQHNLTTLKYFIGIWKL